MEHIKIKYLRNSEVSYLWCIIYLRDLIYIEPVPTPERSSRARSYAGALTKSQNNFSKSPSKI